MSHISGLLNTFGGSVLFSLGQNFHNNREKFYKIYSSFENIFYCISAVCVVMIYIFLNPFLTLYTADITDINYVLSDKDYSDGYAILKKGKKVFYKLF